MNVRARNGVGGFVGGCLAIIIFVTAAVLLSAAAAAYFYKKTINQFTSPQPQNVQRVPSSDQLRRATANLDRLREAVVNDREETIYFSAEELNALIARHPDFAALRGRIAFALDNSLVTLELSAPLDTLRLPGLKGRWFNGTTCFAFDYAAGEFTFLPKSAKAAASRIPDWLVTSEFGSGFRRSFSRSFSRGFHDSVQKNPQAATFWSRIKSIRVEGDKLVVKTQKTGSRETPRLLLMSFPASGSA